MKTINRGRLHELHRREEQKFIVEHPKSAELYARAKGSLFGGVPMNWMKKWAGAFPVFVAHAKGAHFADVDRREYVDLAWVIPER
jgi:glutamate-1-semialdehyde 2,1-aminomutase